GVAFERRVGGEVKLSGQRLVPRRSDHVVDVLADAPWIMARHNGIEPILARIVSRYRRPVAKTLQIVLAPVIRLPDLDPGVRQRGAGCAEHQPRNRKRQPGITRGAQMWV